MESAFKNLIERSKNAIRYWWLVLLVGLALFGAGIVVFMHPAESYLSLALLFGIIILTSGIFELVLAATAKGHYITGRGWMIAAGVIELILGIVLCSHPLLSAVTLPIFLGFWLLFRGFASIGWGSDMRSMGIPGAGWTIASGVLLLLLGIWIVLQPLAVGTTAVVLWVGISLLVAGISACAFSIQLRSLHKYVK